MTYPRVLPTEVALELAATEERPLSAEEFAARVAAPWTDFEAEQFDELVAWFRRRYATPAARLAATRHLMAQLPGGRAARSDPTKI